MGSIVKRFAISVLLVGIIAAGVLAALFPASRAGAGSASTGKCDAVATIAPRDSLTARAVSAATAFEASLSPVQRAAVQHSFDSPKRSGWSSVPTNLARRNGVAVGDLSARQRARLWALLRTIMSAQGYADEVGVRKADTYLRLTYRGETTPASI